MAKIIVYEKATRKRVITYRPEERPMLFNLEDKYEVYLPDDGYYEYPKSKYYCEEEK